MASSLRRRAGPGRHRGLALPLHPGATSCCRDPGPAALTTPAGKEQAQQHLCPPKPRENALPHAALSQDNFLLWAAASQSSHVYSTRTFLAPVCPRTEITAQHQYETVSKTQSIRLPGSAVPVTPRGAGDGYSCASTQLHRFHQSSAHDSVGTTPLSLQMLALAVTGHRGMSHTGRCSWHPAPRHGTFLCPTTPAALPMSPKAWPRCQKMSILGEDKSFRKVNKSSTYESRRKITPCTTFNYRKLKSWVGAVTEPTATHPACGRLCSEAAGAGTAALAARTSLPAWLRRFSLPCEY